MSASCNAGDLAPRVSDVRRLAAQKWRRVASTHKLEDLLNPSLPDRPKLRPGLLWVGCALLVSSVAVFGAASVGIWLDSSLQPAMAYYSQLMVAWIPVTGIFVVCNWFCMKLFKHNS